MSESQSNGPKSTQSAREQVIRWDDSGVKNSYANACNVSSTREEIVLNFGLNQAGARSQSEVQVQLTNRIILSPYAAKRVALLLGAVVQQYESRFGALDIGMGQTTGGQPTDSSQTTEMKPHIVK